MVAGECDMVGCANDGAKDNLYVMVEVVMKMWMIFLSVFVALEREGCVYGPE
jgi:hypothetical protein